MADSMNYESGSLAERVKFAIGGFMHDDLNPEADLNVYEGLTGGISALNGSCFEQNTTNQCTPVSILLEQESDSSDEVGKHHEMLIELFDLELHDKNGEWMETARWVKYEEDVEGADHHWGKPHVAFLSFHSLIQLRRCIHKGIILLDLNTSTYADICDEIIKAMKAEGTSYQEAKQVLAILQMKQIHQYSQNGSRVSMGGQRHEGIPSTLSAIPVISNCNTFKTEGRHNSFQLNGINKQPAIAEVDGSKSFMGKTELSPEFFRRLSSPIVLSCMSPTILNSIESMKKCRPSFTHFLSNTREVSHAHSSEVFPSRDHFTRKLPSGTETAQVFVGAISNLSRINFVLIRSADAIILPELADGAVPTRFVLLIVGPKLVDVCYHELGRSIATLMTDKHFNHTAYTAKEKDEIIAGIDRFLDDSIVIPPGKVDSKKLLSGNEIKRALKRRKEQKKRNECLKKPDSSKKSETVVVIQSKIDKNRKHGTSNYLFSGAIQDVTNRFPHYWSDIRDAFNFQCITAIVFMFFASFAPAITFGGLMGKYTNEKIGMIETLVAQCICGVIWGIFSVQPVMILSATGPVLIFETSLNMVCENLNLDFLSVRLHAGIYVLLIGVITVAFNGSQLLIYVTRFTEDIFACLISVIFVAESLSFIYQAFVNNPLKNYDYYHGVNDACAKSNRTDEHFLMNASNAPCLVEPNTALLSLIILFCTFIIAYGLRQLRQSFYLSRTLRRAISDFGVLIAIVSSAGFTHLLIPDLHLAVLEMPDHLNFTNAAARGHGVIVSALTSFHKWQTVLISPVAAVLVFILLFVETEITELLLSRKDRKLLKGTGMHWDLLLTCICVAICSIFGLPWMCAAAVQSLAHCGSLTVMKKTAPGERPKVDFVIEQRMTAIGVSLLIGLTALGGSYLRLPLASLFGVFLYLGLMNLSGVQLVQRIILFFIPSKYFPSTAYTETVSVWRIHLYTAIQVLCLIIVIVMKSFKQTALAFPFVLILFICIRRLVISKVFTKEEVDALDGDERSEDDWLENDGYENVPLPI